MSHIDPMTLVHGGGPKSPSGKQSSPFSPTQWWNQEIKREAATAGKGSSDPNNPFDTANAAVAKKDMDMKWLMIAGAAIAAWYFLAQ